MPRLLWWGGIAALAGGAVLCVVGWYGVSGERFAERQLAYLASSTVPGAALLVAGAVWVAASGGAAPRGGPGNGDTGEPGREVGAEQGAEEGTFRPSSQDPPVRVPDGTLAHRPDCPLVAGKPDVAPVGDAKLEPCPVCAPDLEGGAGGGTGGGSGGGP
ncbi:hypothetical protein [Streptomyces sp. TRM64462]|uniref:hypothetical protein n=1 Tax=Streptomyces sp. TRM64462 TaxID=2741726 RepID=UPI00158629B4|nr:hypothetical protein [Streptomyces sp. TRM64462]